MDQEENLPPELQALHIVTAESLASHCGIPQYGQSSVSEVLKLKRTGYQLGYVQQRPKDQQEEIYSEVAAKYLPDLVKAYRKSSGALNAPTMLINTMGHTPYFARFMRTSAGDGIVGIQAQRMTEESTHTLNADGIAEIGQFLSTVLVLRGTSEIQEEVKHALLPKLVEWQRTYQGRFASETSHRCYTLLTNDPTMLAMSESMKEILEKKLEECGAQGCDRRTSLTGAKMMQCSKCKAAVYCGPDHQKQAWPSHKRYCFPASF